MLQYSGINSLEYRFIIGKKIRLNKDMFTHVRRPNRTHLFVVRKYKIFCRDNYFSFPFFQLSLNLLTSVSKIHKSCMATIPNEILPQILILIQSPLLQGGALNALLEFFQALVATGLPKLGFKDLLQVCS